MALGAYHALRNCAPSIRCDGYTDAYLRAWLTISNPFRKALIAVREVLMIWAAPLLIFGGPFLIYLLATGNKPASVVKIWSVLVGISASVMLSPYLGKNGFRIRIQDWLCRWWAGRQIVRQAGTESFPSERLYHLAAKVVTTNRLKLRLRCYRFGVWVMVLGQTTFGLLGIVAKQPAPIEEILLWFTALVAGLVFVLRRWAALSRQLESLER
jgi:hypothetical protein